MAVAAPRTLPPWLRSSGLWPTRTTRTSAGGAVRCRSRSCAGPIRPAGLRWLDVGCGTGGVDGRGGRRHGDPESGRRGSVRGLPRSGTNDRPGRDVPWRRRDHLPLFDDDVDVVVSGLALNFVPQPSQAVAEFTRVAKPGATVAAYVWDYADGMAMIRYLFDAAMTLDTGAAELDEGRRFPLCSAEALEQLWNDHGLAAVAVEPIEVPTRFRDFDDYWSPFLGGQGAAPGYVMSLTDDRRAKLRELLRERLPTRVDGSIPLTARAWAVRGVVRR